MVTQPLRILLSRHSRPALQERIASVLGSRPHRIVEAGNAAEDADIAFVSRDITGLSTKHRVLPPTQQFYDAMLGATSLRWVHTHSAGADRPVFVELRRSRAVEVTTSSGTNADVVAQTALAGLLALTRRLPQLMAAQRNRTWAPLIDTGLPRDLAGQTAVIVGWGPIGQRLGSMLRLLDLNVIAVRSCTHADAGEHNAQFSVTFETILQVLPCADWLILACPLTERTRGLIDREALAAMPCTAHLINVARGEIVVEADLINALSAQLIAGAFLDVFEHEPLGTDSPLWSMPNVIVTPHTAGHSDGHEKRVADLFMENLQRWQRGEPLRNRVA